MEANDNKEDDNKDDDKENDDKKIDNKKDDNKEESQYVPLAAMLKLKKQIQPTTKRTSLTDF